MDKFWQFMSGFGTVTQTASVSAFGNLQKSYLTFDPPKGSGWYLVGVMPETQRDPLYGCVHVIFHRRRMRFLAALEEFKLV